MTQTYVDLIILITYLATIVLTCINVANFINPSLFVSVVVIGIYVAFWPAAAILTTIFLPLNLMALVAAPAISLGHTQQYYRNERSRY